MHILVLLLFWTGLLIPAQSVKCYKCEGEQCNKGSCIGRWCKKTSLANGKSRYRCEDQEFLSEGCNELIVFGYKVHQCFCDNRDFCTADFDIDTPFQQNEEDEEESEKAVELEEEEEEGEGSRFRFFFFLLLTCLLVFYRCCWAPSHREPRSIIPC